MRWRRCCWPQQQVCVCIRRLTTSNETLFACERSAFVSALIDTTRCATEVAALEGREQNNRFILRRLGANIGLHSGNRFIALGCLNGWLTFHLAWIEELKRIRCLSIASLKVYAGSRSLPTFVSPLYSHPNNTTLDIQMPFRLLFPKISWWLPAPPPPCK